MPAVTFSLVLVKKLTVSTNIITEQILLVGTRSQMARAPVEERKEDSGEEDAPSPANDSRDDGYHTSDAKEVSSSS